MLFTVYFSGSVTVLLKKTPERPRRYRQIYGFYSGVIETLKESRKHARGTKKVIAAVEVCAAAPWRGGGGALCEWPRSGPGAGQLLLLCLETDRYRWSQFKEL